MQDIASFPNPVVSICVSKHVTFVGVVYFVNAIGKLSNIHHRE